MSNSVGNHSPSLPTSSQAAMMAASSAASTAASRWAEPMTYGQFNHARNDLIRRLREPGESKSGEAGRALCSMYETLLRRKVDPAIQIDIRQRRAFLQSELELLEARDGGLAAPASAAIAFLKDKLGEVAESTPTPRSAMRPETKGDPDGRPEGAAGAAPLPSRGQAEPMTLEQFRHARNGLIRRLRQPGESKSGEAGRALCSMYETVLRATDHPLIGKGIRDRQGGFIEGELKFLTARAGGLDDSASAAIKLLVGELTKGSNLSLKDAKSFQFVALPGGENELFSAPRRPAPPLHGISSLETQAEPGDAPSRPTATPAEFRSFAEFAEARMQLLLPSRLLESKVKDTRQVLRSMYETVLRTPNHPVVGDNPWARMRFIKSELKFLKSSTEILLSARDGGPADPAAPISDAVGLLRNELAKAGGPTRDYLLDCALSAVLEWTPATDPPESLEKALKFVFRRDSQGTPASERIERRKNIYEKFCLSAEVPAAVRQCAYLAYMRRQWPDAQTALRHVLEMQAFGAGSEPDDALDSVRFVPVLRAMGFGAGCDVAEASAVFSRSPVPADEDERHARLARVRLLLTADVD